MDIFMYINSFSLCDVIGGLGSQREGKLYVYHVGGVPAAPNITLMGSILNWNEPVNNGEAIREYIIRLT